MEHGAFPKTSIFKSPYLQIDHDAIGENLNISAHRALPSKEMLKTVAKWFKFSASECEARMHVARVIVDLNVAEIILHQHLP